MSVVDRQSSIAAAWESFRNVIPASASLEQFVEMRRAFFAGAWHVLCVQKDIGDRPTETEESDVAILEAMIAEAVAFKESVERGEA